ncbi:polycystic kidney disease protein 1-like 3 [Rhinatrema bivittatum]|uniref:polycystic kidney disease protein 1-like 3 n=1 Tax=Rhinatrema bivittatum TaxID=194408 RepID=UPI00112D7BA5|nr:polycystic kidney disease protein 1-like 3 [Rhinatrema bivittatum]
MAIQDTSALHASSYTTPEPARVQITFPSNSALQSLINKYPQSQIQVTAFTFNPFENISRRDIVGNVANVILMSQDELMVVSNLTEDIEIVLSRHESLEVFTTQHNMSLKQVLVIAVNMTSKQDSLIVQLQPDRPLPFRFYLGFQYQPNDTHFDLTMTLPNQGIWFKVEENTWILSPEQLKNGTGIYHITAVLQNSSAWAEQTHVICSLTTFATQCLFWNSSLKTWEGNGCHVGPRTTVTSTQCLCNHLTFFGATFFIMPRTVDIRDTARLFTNVSKNPVGLSFLCSILGFYLLIVVWARMKDKQDKTKAKITVLADNDTIGHYRYMVQVFTGYRRGAATTSKVAITVYGSEGQSKPHHLTDSTKAVFERGGVDIFLIKTQFLGQLHSIRLWHDNSGISPSWYVSRVIVTDLGARRKWYFLCESWLATDLEDCCLDKVFPTALESDLMCLRNAIHKAKKDFYAKRIHNFIFDSKAFFSYVSSLTKPPQLSIPDHQALDKANELANYFKTKITNLTHSITTINYAPNPPSKSQPQQKYLFSRTVERLFKDHLWFSVLNRCPWSPFTRVQRISCCLTLLICNMLINIMFWDDSSNSSQLGQFLVTVTQLKISIQTTLILFPANLVIVQMFHLIQVKLQEGWHSPSKLQVSLSSSLLSDMDASTKLIKDLKETVVFLYQYMMQVLDLTVEDVGHSDSLSELMKTLSFLIHAYLRNSSEGKKIPLSFSAPGKGITIRDWHFLCYLRKVLEMLHCEMKVLDLSSEQQPDEFIRATDELQHLMELLQRRSEPNATPITSMVTGFPIPNRTQRVSISSHLPTWFPHVCWFCLFAISAFSAFYLVLLSLNMSKEKAISWLISMVLSLLQSIFLLPPVKVFLQTLFLSRILKSEEMVDACEERQMQGILSHLGLDFIAMFLGFTGRRPDWELSGWRDQKNPIYTSPAMDNIGRCILRKKMVKEKELYQLIRDIIGMGLNGICLDLLWDIGILAAQILSFHKENPLCHCFNLFGATLAMPSHSISQIPPFKLKPSECQETELNPSTRLNCIAHILFLTTMMIIAYAEKTPNEFYLNQSMQRSFATSFNQIQTLDDFYAWAQNNLLPNLYSTYPGYITDGNSFLLGSARIRQLRIKHNPDPYDNPYGSEDTEDYGPLWISPIPNSSAQNSNWHYQTQKRLEGYPIWAKFAIYSGGGYTAELGGNSTTAARVLEILRDTGWLDGASKVIFVEFSVFNANTNLFCIATFILENNGIGNLFASTDLQIMRFYQSGIQNMLLLCVQVSFLLLILFSVIQQGLRLKIQKIHYFSSTKNLVDLSIIVISFCSIAIYVKRIILQTRDIQRYHQNRSRFVSFYETATIERAHVYLTAFLVSLATVKLWSMLQLNPKLHLISMTLRRAWQEMSGFLLVFLLMLVAYSVTCNLVFGWSVSNYKTFINSAVTIVSLLIGLFNYDEVLNLDPILGSLLITTCIIFLLFVVINLFLSAMLMVFSKERKSPTVSSETQDIMLM